MAYLKMNHKHNPDLINSLERMKPERKDYDTYESYLSAIKSWSEHCNKHGVISMSL